MLTTTVQLPGAAAYDSHMEKHTLTVNTDISLVREFQRHILDSTRKHGVIYQVKYRKMSIKKSGPSTSIMFKKAKMCNTHQKKLHVLKLSSQNYHFAVSTQNTMECKG